MKAAIYRRVSTEDQEREGTSLQTQLDALDIKVYARDTRDVEIQGVIPLELPTTEQT
jgi:DNA invertase Pin-like site-specific DNA recombinase